MHWPMEIRELIRHWQPQIALLLRNKFHIKVAVLSAALFSFGMRIDDESP